MKDNGDREWQLYMKYYRNAEGYLIQEQGQGERFKLGFDGQVRMSQKKRNSTDINICKDVKQCFFQMAWTTYLEAFHMKSFVCLEQHLKINKIEEMSDFHTS